MRRDALERVLATEAAVAEQLRHVPEWIWDGKSFPVPLADIVDSHYGLLVCEETDLARQIGRSEGPHISGLLFPGRKEIWVDAGEAHRWPGRKRFTIAHEIGHWVLHCDMSGTGTEPVHCREEILDEEGASQEGDAPNEPTPRHRPRYPPEERDANQFGAALLMPRELVEEEHAHLDGDERRLAEAFGVSVRAMEWRIWFLEQMLGFSH
jgi:Zn-dependent peptidase ImmA (M78 family)